MKVIKFLTQKIFSVIFAPGGERIEGSQKCSTGPQLSEYVQVVCRNTNLLKNRFQKHLLSGFSEISSYYSIQPNQPNIGQIWINIDQKASFFKFTRKTKVLIFFGLQRVGFLQKIRKFQRVVFEKMLKTPHIWVFWAKKANFGPFLAKKGPFSNFR